MSASIELVIFDCDGVLVDSERIAVRVDRVILEQAGLRLSEEEIIERFVGRSDQVFIAAIEEHIGEPLPDGWLNRFDAAYRDALASELTPVDGIVDALRAIPYASCVASSGSHEKMRFTLGLTGLYHFFEGRIFSATEVRKGKPAPDLFLHAARAMGVDPAACVVVEDSRYGVQAARAAGMRAFGFTGGLTPAAMLQGANTVLFDDMRDLPQLLAVAASVKPVSAPTVL
ncbi:HAD family hydrolase [Planotetraspora sp. A-T 1434]|uniref:HAD family hydrolase n=1 Tax=Planotetraspora sp. A-T 1434 TaxID=2979219 RepID=UPI0021BF8095|nr:HAD family hydrolase [Planotetraspora sp. A-T 1434]MCT9934118.1 HAD family hydrolase [Planotetraspora sp. A-T 1434]